MSHDTIEERFAKIESKQSFHDAAIIEYRSDSREIKESLNEIKTSLAVSNSQALEPRVRALEDKANLAFGGWKMLTLFGGLGLLLLKELVTFLHGSH